MAHSYHYESMRTARLLLGCAVLLLVGDVVALPLLVTSGGFGIAAAVVLVVLTLIVGFYAVEHGDDAGVIFEQAMRRRFRAVCREKNLTTKDDAGRLVYPGMSQLMGNGDAWRVTIRPLFGQSVADWERSGPAFALAFSVAGVRFRDNGDGTLSMRAGYTKLEAREMVVSGLDDAPEELPTGSTWRERLASVVVGTTENGRAYALPLLDTHVLVVGITGAGKGSVLWSLILGLVPAIRAGVVRLWAIDPKRLELAMGRQVFGDRYAAEEVAMVELLELAVADMHTRADELAGKARKFTPSPEHPVNVIFLDELGYLASLITDRNLSKRADKAITTLLILGRALGFVCIGAVQDPRKDNVDFRDNFPTKVAMKLPKPMVDLVLGNGMHEAGALCDLIPLGRDGAGVAFVTVEGSAIPVCVRFDWCSDELIQRTAAVLAPVVQSPRLSS